MWKKRVEFIDFINAIEDLELVEKYSERVNTICGVKINDLTFMPYNTLKHSIPELIKELKFEEAIYEVIKVRKKSIKFKRVKRVDNYTKLKFYFFMKDQYKLINQLEAQYLVSLPDPKLVNAGIRELDILGDKNLIDALAGGDILKWEAVSQLPYGMVFDKQLKNKIEAKVTKKLNEDSKNS